MSIQEARFNYSKNGVAKIRGVFSKEEMDDLRCRAWRAYRRAPEAHIQYRGLFPALLFGPDGVDKFRNDKRMKNIVRQFLGDDVLQLNNQIYFRLPGDGDQFAWHQDITFRTPKENFDRIETGYLQTAIVIDSMREDNSPIEFVEGSHLNEDLNLIPRDNSERGLREYDNKFDGTAMMAESGDVLVWSVMVVHGSKPNLSSIPRMYYMNGFAKAECVKTNEFPTYLKKGKLCNP